MVEYNMSYCFNLLFDHCMCSIMFSIIIYSLIMCYTQFIFHFFCFVIHVDANTAALSTILQATCNCVYRYCYHCKVTLIEFVITSHYF